MTDQPMTREQIADMLKTLQQAMAALDAPAASRPETVVLAVPGGAQTFVKLPAGSFLMGSPESEEGRFESEGPQHTVTLANPPMLADTPVTYAQYDAFCEATGRSKPSDNGWGRGDRPVTNVSWYDAKAYCLWLSERLGKVVDLPSEAEWEYACRAGTTTPFSTGATISTDQANYDGNYTYGKGQKGVYRKQTTPVKTFAPNPWGLYDMHGNVWEWCEDVWHADYEGAPTDGSARRP